MAEEWFVRVEGKEYGPVDLDALQEWKTEGRLIAQNYVRRDGDSSWVLASSIPDLFPSLTSDNPEANPSATGRTLLQIFAETVQVYRKGFLVFLALSFLVALPSLGFQLSFAYVHYPADGGLLSTTTRVASALSVVMFGLVLVSWPIFIGGLQFATGEITAGRPVRLGEILRRAINFWPRIARLCLFVYGSYLFWTALPVLIILTLASTPSLLSISVALVALAFQVYMAGKLFINFMFWQQSCTLGGLDPVEALRESKELARSRPTAPMLQRPLYRGALIASIWLVILIVVSVAVEMPFMAARLQGITNFEDAYAMVKTLSEASAPDAMSIVSDVLSTFVHAILRPLLGIAFVLLYFDAKASR